MRGVETVRLLSALLLLILLACSFGCAVNPVTGKNELHLVSEAQEKEIGAQQYAPSRQMQGGDFTTYPRINAYVSEVGQRLAAVSDRKLPYEFQVINDSTPNAWALPGGKIAVNRGLLTELESEAELAAVLGHEIVHAAARHGAQSMERGMLLQGAVLAAGVAASNSEYAGLAVGGASLAAGLMSQKYGRDAESESDYYGMRYMKRAGYNPEAAVKLQETFVRLSEGRQENWLSGLFASHPPSRERVAANRKTVAELGGGGEWGTQRYAQQMRPLLAASEGYKAYDQGRKALAEGNLDQALRMADKALKVEPKEGLFHALRGDIRFKQGRYQDAVTNFDRAVARNPGYFHFYLQRGLALQKLGRDRQAKTDLERSVELLPTAPALNALGRQALLVGQLDQAKGLFARAAGSDSPAGKDAAVSLARLELADDPSGYLPSRLRLSRSGYLVVEVGNRAPLAVEKIEIGLRYRAVDGRWQQRKLSISGRLGPGESGRFRTRIGPFTSAAQLQGSEVKVLRVRVRE